MKNRAEPPFSIHPFPASSLVASRLLLLLSLASASCHADVKTGADILIERRLDLVRNKNVGLITNQTGRLSTGESLVDALRAHGVRVAALFNAEHGIRGQAEAGVLIPNETDSATGVPVYSLYGPNKKLERSMLNGIDLLIYDIQDVGVRYYTYINTMGLAMEAAADAGVPFIVLDRPDVLGGQLVEGPVLQDSLRSHVGMFPIPVIYGLTCGELAEMINQEKWLSGGRRADLTVVPVEGWSRAMPWDETGRIWHPPSPNIPTPGTALVYPATCYIEGTNLSEGRGTSKPFTQFGAPFLDAGAMAASLDSLGLPGVRFGATSFTPESSKLAGQLCQGVTVEIADFRTYSPVSIGLHILDFLARRYPKECQFDRKWLCFLFGSGDVLELIDGRKSVEEVLKKWSAEAKGYAEKARRYWLY